MHFLNQADQGYMMIPILVIKLIAQAIYEQGGETILANFLEAKWVHMGPYRQEMKGF